MKLNDRVSRLETRKGRSTLHWVDPAYEGQPLEEAIADYRAETGAGSDAIFIHWNVFGEARAA